MRGMTLATVSVPRTLRLITALCKLSDLMHTLNVSSSAPASLTFTEDEACFGSTVGGRKIAFGAG